MAYCDATGVTTNGRQSVSVLAYDNGQITLMFFDVDWDLAPGELVEAIANVDYVECQSPERRSHRPFTSP